MDWYNRIAGVYDIFTNRFYDKSRRELIERLDLKKGEHIFVPACGTRQNFGFLLEKIGKTAKLSPLMLQKPCLPKPKNELDKIIGKIFN